VNEWRSYCLIEFEGSFADCSGDNALRADQFRIKCGRLFFISAFCRRRCSAAQRLSAQCQELRSWIIHFNAALAALGVQRKPWCPEIVCGEYHDQGKSCRTRHLRDSDLDRAIVCYTEVNGLALHAKSENSAFLASKIGLSPFCQQAAARPGIPTLIFIGALDDWTPAADCSNKVAAWGNDGPPIELVVYPGAYHRKYNGEAADNASHRLHQFLDRHLN